MIEQIHRFVIPAAYSLLPAQMNTPAATAMLLAVGLQESRFQHRQQIGGPAHGLWQFERGGGIIGVLTHAASKPHVERALRALLYERVPDLPLPQRAAACYALVVDNDVLAAVFARLLLWTVPGRLPLRHESAYAWRIYADDALRPGRPHPETWNGFYAQAWAMVGGGE